MSLNDIMGGSQKIKKVHINELRLNENNKYDLDNIEELAQQIKEHGQLENGVVYQEEGEDDKHYTIIGGHRRYTAIKTLYDRNEHDGLMNILIINKPKDKQTEEMLIVQDNNQRIKTKKERLKEVKVAIDYYNSLEDTEKTNIGEGLKYRDKIGKLIGISGRQVQKYMNTLDDTKDKVKEDYTILNISKELNSTVSKLSNLLKNIDENDITVMYKGKDIREAIEIEMNRVKSIRMYIENIKEE